MLAALQKIQRLQRLRAGLVKGQTPSTGSDFSKLARFAEGYRNNYLGFTKLLEIDSRHGRVPFELNPVQLGYHAVRTPRDVVLKSRRIGMTTEGIARDVWHFLTYPDIPSVAIVCQSATGHGPVLDVRKIVTTFFESLRERGLPLLFAKETETDWQLANGASLRIVEAGASKAAAAKKGRAGRITRLHCTELAFWEHAGETLNALSECVDRPDFEIEYESTANGAASEDRGNPKDAPGSAAFHWAVQDAQRGESGFRFHFFAWYRDPTCATALDEGEQVAPTTPRERALVDRHGVTPEQLKWYQGKLAAKRSQELVDQEYPSDPDTCFLLTGRGFFDAARTALLLTQCTDPIELLDVREPGARGQTIGTTEVAACRVWHRPEPGKRYVVALDTSEGIGADASAGIVLERGTGRHMATLWGQFKPWELARIAVGLAVRYNHAEIAVERNNHGHACLRALDAEQRYPNIYKDRDGKPGWLNVETSRTAALDTLEQAHRVGNFETRDRFLLSEMRTFVVTERGKAEGAKGAHDDLVMATAIGWDVICQVMRGPKRNLEILDLSR
jgi:hypothetical protein